MSLYTFIRGYTHRHTELAVPRVPVAQRVGHPLPDELRAVRAQHRIGPVLPPAGGLSRHPRHRLER